MPRCFRREPRACTDPRLTRRRPGRPSTASGPCRCAAGRRVDLVLNLTVPDAHSDVCLAALPRASTCSPRSRSRRPQPRADEIVAEAAPARLPRFGPRPIPGRGGPPAPALVDEGAIGRPSWHGLHDGPGHGALAPEPAFYSSRAAGRCWTWGPTTSRCWSACSARRAGAASARGSEQSPGDRAEGRSGHQFRGGYRSP